MDGGGLSMIMTINLHAIFTEHWDSEHRNSLTVVLTRSKKPSS